VVEIPGECVKLRKKEKYARSSDLLQALKKHLKIQYKLSFSIKDLWILQYVCYLHALTCASVQVENPLDDQNIFPTGALPHTMLF